MKNEVTSVAVKEVKQREECSFCVPAKGCNEYNAKLMADVLKTPVNNQGFPLVFVCISVSTPKESEAAEPKIFAMSVFRWD